MNFEKGVKTTFAPPEARDERKTKYGLGVELTDELPLALQKLVIMEKLKKQKGFTPDPSYMKFAESRYDLPLEQQRHSVKAWLKNLPAAAASRYSFALDMSRTRSRKRVIKRESRFVNLDPSILLSRLETRPEFRYVRELAIERLQCEVMRQLQLIYHNSMCSTQLFTADKLPHRVFSWTSDDFLKRRKLKDFLWMELLMQQGEVCLGKQKFQFDLHELFRFLKELFKATTCGYKDDDHCDRDFYDWMLDLTDFLKVHETLENDLDKHKKKFREDVNMSLAVSFTRRDELESSAKRRLAERLMEFDVLNPIQMRYHLGYIESGVQQVQISGDMAGEKLAKEIENEKAKLKLEQKNFQDSMSVCYTLTQTYKHQITKYTNKYETDFESVDAEAMYLKGTIEKLHAQQIFYEKKIVHFHDEIERMRLKDIAEKAAEELRQRQEAEALELKLLKKAQKAAKLAAKKKAAKKR